MSPRITDQNARDAKREEILQAALRVFSERGLVGSRITDIAEVAGISSALLYHYFKDKESIFTELVSLAYAASVGSFEKALSVEGCPAVRLWFLIDFVFSYAYEGDGPLYFLLMIQAGTLSPVPEAVENLQRGNERRYGELLIPLIRAGQEAGELRSGNTEALYSVLIALIEGYAVLAGDRRMRTKPPATDMLAAAFMTDKGWSQVRAWQAAGGPAMAYSRCRGAEK